MRKLKYHEQKLLKKVNFLEWEDTNTKREQIIIGKYLLKSRDEYKFYSRIVGMIRKLAESLSRLTDNDPTKMLVSKKLINLLYETGIIENKKLIDCTTVGVSSLCQRRIPSIMVSKGLVQGYKEADTFVQQGHIRMGNRLISDTSTLVSKAMEDFVTWTDSSKIRRKIDEFNGNYDDYRYAQL
ncbi:U3 small nucleolar ribonucleoprotein IMP3 [Pancytospora epiphaga]|nr:U3 small nucleolar ribonucleoprotein IMP3 [Pancytospora epiphaga]